MPNEKNKSKAELKKEATAAKLAFISQAYTTALTLIPAQTEGSRSKLKVHLTHTNHNRCIKFSAYGRSLNLQIFGDGNVTAELEEFCHNKYTEVLFEYDPDPKAQKEFLLRFELLAAMLINEFMDCGVLDWHSYMDYVWEEKNLDKAYHRMMAEYIGYEEGDAHEPEQE